MTPHNRLPASSTAFLPESSTLRRQPLAPQRKRPERFLESYESRALVYDCFWDQAGERVILVGPPALNLEPELTFARFSADGGKTQIKAQIYPSRSTMLIVLEGVPREATEITFGFSDLNFVLPIRHNEAEAFRNRKILVTMNKDNDLEWIIAWARWHTLVHNADACLFFDNGSTRYSPLEVAEALSSVKGLAEVRVLSWPHKYGRKDPAVLDRPHYPHFLQVSSLNVALRRFSMRAAGLLNCDIDELVSTVDGDILELAGQSPQGIVTLKGRWIEPIEDIRQPQAIPHLRYRHSHKLPLLWRCANKWALDPSRQWLQDLSAKPSVHRIYDVPRSLQASAPAARFWHFKAINTGWKESRKESRLPSFAIERPADLEKDATHFAQLRSRTSRAAPSIE